MDLRYDLETNCIEVNIEQLIGVPKWEMESKKLLGIVPVHFVGPVFVC